MNVRYMTHLLGLQIATRHVLECEKMRNIEAVKGPVKPDGRCKMLAHISRILNLQRPICKWQPGQRNIAAASALSVSSLMQAPLFLTLSSMAHAVGESSTL